MGVIKRQGIKHSIITYLGVVIGIINTLFIYPRMLPADLGLIRFIMDTATLIIPIALLGFNHVSIRFYPDFKDEENGHNGLLFFLISGVTTGLLFLLMLVGLFHEQIYALYENKGSVYLDNLIFIVPLIILGCYSRVFTDFAVNRKRVAIPQIFNNLYVKLGQGGFVLLFLMGFIELRTVLWGLVGVYSLILISNISYIKVLGQLNLKPNISILKDRKFLKEIAVYALFGIFGSIGTILATRIDIFMLGSLDFDAGAVAANLPGIPFDKANLSCVGIYSISIFLAGIIEVPTRAIISIIQPIVAQAWKDLDLEHIQELYTKASLNLMIVGVLILAIIWASIDDLFSFMQNGELYRLGKYVFLFIGLTKLFDMATSINTPIIGFSEYFRFNFYAILVLAVFNIGANLLLIPSQQVNGAAIATMTSLILFNVIKFGFIWWKMKMQPFSWGLLWVIGFGLISYLIGTNIPLLGNFYLDIIARSLIILSTYIVLILGFKISPDVNKLFFNTLQQIKGKLS